MAYGDRNMRKEPGSFGAVDLLGMGLAAAFGIIAAIVFDLTQHDEGSALFVINKWIARLTEVVGIGAIPLYGVVLILMGLGALSILYFQPVTMRGAFAQGFGALAALTTIAPSDLGTALPGGGAEDLPPPAFEQPATTQPASFVAAAGTSSTTNVASATASLARAEGYAVRIRVNFPDGLSGDIAGMVQRGTLRGRLWNETAGRTYNLFRSGGGELEFENGSLFIETVLPGKAETATLWTRIEAEGYAIQVENYMARQGANPVWTVNMRPSGRPLFLQRMGQSYRF